jgi:hypothetical protein
VRAAGAFYVSFVRNCQLPLVGSVSYLRGVIGDTRQHLEAASFALFPSVTLSTADV